MFVGDVGFRRLGSVCTPCPIGEYNDLIDQTACKTCPTDHTTAATGASSLDDCTGKSISASTAYTWTNKFMMGMKTSKTTCLFPFSCSPQFLK